MSNDLKNAQPLQEFLSGFALMQYNHDTKTAFLNGMRAALHLIESMRVSNETRVNVESFGLKEAGQNGRKAAEMIIEFRDSTIKDIEMALRTKMSEFI